MRLLVEEFCNCCESFFAVPGLSPELTYRIDKLKDTVAPLEGKVYLKTLKGRETLLKCIEKLNFIKDRPTGDVDALFRLLTDLEIACDDLLVHTYEFRIKAG